MLDINAIKKREQKASKGIWKVKEEIDGIYAGRKTVVVTSSEQYRPKRIMSVGQTRRHINKEAEANADFIANAKQDIPLLIAELEKLNISKKELIDINSYYHDWCSEMLNIFYFLEEGLEMKYNIKLPKSVYDDIKNITENFSFKYENK